MVKFNNHFSLNNNPIRVNSFHHNVINSTDLGKNLLPFAISEYDNTVEGFLHDELQIFGVMWHPERHPDANSNNLFKKIFPKKQLT